MVGCMVSGCRTKWTKKGTEYGLYSFPRDPEKIRRWLYQIGFDAKSVEDLLMEIAQSSTRAYRVCGKHFSTDSFELRGFYYHLRKDAIPTLHLNYEPVPEHCYSKIRRLEEVQTTGQSSGTSSTIVPFSIHSDHLPRPSCLSETSDSSLVTVQPQSVVLFESEMEVQHEEDVLTSELLYQTGLRLARKRKIQRHTRSIGISTTYTPSQKHKNTQFDRKHGVSNKSTATKYLLETRSRGIQCNERDLMPLQTVSHIFGPISSCTEDFASQGANTTPSEVLQIPPTYVSSSLLGPRTKSPIRDIGLSPPAVSAIACSPHTIFLDASQLEGESLPTPAKQSLDDCYHPTPEEEEEFLQEMRETVNFGIDPKYLDSSFIDLPENNEKNYADERKFIVFESCLDELLKMIKCQASHTCSGSLVKIRKFKMGSCVSVMAICSRKHKYFLWRSQPLIGNIPVGNLLISCGILCSGSNYLKLDSFFRIIGLLGIGNSTHYNNQKKFLFPTISHYWNLQRTEALQTIGSESISLSGDGQFDSPGHNAKFCVYSFMDHKTKRIIDFQVEQIIPGTSSVTLEKKTFQICLERLLKDNLNIYIVCTDRHVSIRKLMREKYDHIVHEFDVWHVAKSVGSKITAASRKSKCGILSKWVGPTKNHLWWSAKTCQRKPTLLLEKWSSIVQHAGNEHEWQTGNQYQQCSHDTLTEKSQKRRQWIDPFSTAHGVFKSIVLNQKLLKDLEQLSCFCHTGELEVFHTTTLKYRPKRNHLFIDGMVARTQLAVLDHNHNINRMQAVVKKKPSHGSDPGTLRHRYVHSKGKKNWVVEKVYEPTNQAFLKPILNDVLEVAAGRKVFPWVSRKLEYPKNIVPVPILPTE